MEEAGVALDLLLDYRVERRDSSRMCKEKTQKVLLVLWMEPDLSKAHAVGLLPDLSQS